MIGGQERTAAGHVQVDGQDLATLSHEALYASRLPMGMLFQLGLYSPICRYLTMWLFRCRRKRIFRPSCLKI
ncbi:MAG TPA: hypothetical protein PLC34_03970 [Burkholderiaceae bacterium]|nr:hypothetical protein [Burkholderiaceae bacterium]